MASQSAESELISETKDLIQSVLSNDLYGKRIYLLGSAEFGPVNEPIKIKSSVGLYNKFGKSGTLINAFHAVKYTTKNNEVYLVKTTGEHAYCYINTNTEAGIINNSFILMSSEANELFNEIQVVIDTDSISIIYPNDINLPESVLTYYFTDYPNIDMLANAINLDTKRKKSYILANYTVDSSTRTNNAFYCCNPDIIYFYGGQCGLNYNKNMLYTALTKTYDLLESEPIDIIIPVDAFIDDIYPDDSEDNEYQYGMKYYESTKDYLTKNTLGKQRSFVDQLINFCVKQLNFGLITTGILGFNPIHDITAHYLYESDPIIQKLVACFKYNLSLCLNKDFAFLISAVAGDIAYNHGTIIDNGYLAYGAFNASIQLNIGNTNYEVSPNIDLYNEFSEEALAYLSQNGIVAYRFSPLYNNVVVYNGITPVSREDSTLQLYCNVRMIQLCIAYLNQLFQYYIGENFVKLMENNTINKNVNSLLSALVSKNVITQYDFSLDPDYQNGHLTINLDLLTNYMTEAIKIRSVVDLIEKD